MIRKVIIISQKICVELLNITNQVPQGRHEIAWGFNPRRAWICRIRCFLTISITGALFLPYCTTSPVLVPGAQHRGRRASRMHSHAERGNEGMRACLNGELIYREFLGFL